MNIVQLHTNWQKNNYQTPKHKSQLSRNFKNKIKKTFNYNDSDCVTVAVLKFISLSISIILLLRSQIFLSPQSPLYAFCVYRSAQVLGLQNRIFKLFDFLGPIEVVFTILPLSLSPSPSLYRRFVGFFFSPSLSLYHKFFIFILFIASLFFNIILTVLFFFLYSESIERC